jgi:hypothetical protein
MNRRRPPVRGPRGRRPRRIPGTVLRARPGGGAAADRPGGRRHQPRDQLGPVRGGDVPRFRAQCSPLRRRADHRALHARSRGPLGPAQLAAFADAFAGYMARKYGKRFREFIGGSDRGPRRARREVVLRGAGHGRPARTGALRGDLPRLRPFRARQVLRSADRRASACSRPNGPRSARCSTGAGATSTG